MLHMYSRYKLFITKAMSLISLEDITSSMLYKHYKDIDIIQQY